MPSATASDPVTGEPPAPPAPPQPGGDLAPPSAQPDNQFAPPPMPPTPAAQPGTEYPPPVAEPRADYPPPPPAPPEGDLAPPPPPPAPEAAAAPPTPAPAESSNDQPPTPPQEGMALWAGMEAPAAPSSEAELSAEDAKAMADLADVDMGDFADDDDGAPAPRDKDAAQRSPESKDDTRSDEAEESARVAAEERPESGAPASDRSADPDEDDESNPVRGRVSVPNLVVPGDEEEVSVKSFDGGTYRTGEVQQPPNAAVTETPDIGDWKPSEPDSSAASNEQSQAVAESKPPETGSAWDAFAQPWLDDDSSEAKQSTSEPEAGRSADPWPAAGAERDDEPQRPEAERSPASGSEAGRSEVPPEAERDDEPQRPGTEWPSLSEPEAGSEAAWPSPPESGAGRDDESQRPDSEWPPSPAPPATPEPVAARADDASAELAGGAKGVASVPSGQLLSAGELPAQLPTPVAQLYGGESEKPGAWPPPSDS